MKCFACVLKELPEQKEATLLPVMLLFAPPKRYPGSMPARSLCGIPVCDDHKSEITLDYLLTDAGFAQICDGFRRAGKVLPERSATKLEFVDINSQEARSFMESTQRRMH